MKIIINATPLTKGGGMQVAHSFIEEIKSYNQHEFHVLLSQELYEQIETEKFASNFVFKKIHFNKGIKSFFKRSVELQKYENDVKPDVVFTVFGPAYWRPKNKHVMGYAIPHYIYIDSPFFSEMSIVNKVKFNLLKSLHLWRFRKEGDFLIVETNDVKEKLNKLYSRPMEEVFVVHNTFNDVYNRFTYENVIGMDANKFRFLVLSAYYPHKNLEIIKPIVRELIRKGVSDVQFVLTMKDDDYHSNFEGFEDYIVNAGVQPISKCPSLFQEADALFLPTLLECFTATYPEAMKMNKPIITTDMGFAKSICKDSALFYSATSYLDAVDKILELKDNDILQEQLIANGVKRLRDFPNAHERAKKYIEILSQII